MLKGELDCSGLRRLSAGDWSGRGLTSSWPISSLVVFLSLAAVAPGPAWGREVRGGDFVPMAAAYVCCDGKGNPGVCAGRLPASEIVSRCVIAHEVDHVSWMSENLPAACEDNGLGHRHFQMTRGQQSEMECRGYSVEVKCLSMGIGLANASEKDLIRWRIRGLRSMARERFSCDPSRDPYGAGKSFAADYRSGGRSVPAMLNR